MSEATGPFPASGSLGVRLRFSPLLREVLRDIIERVHAAQAAVPDEHAAPKPGAEEPHDHDLQAAWAEGLREREDDDARALLDLAKNPQFGQADLEVTSSMAEALMRACVRVRLHLRETLLRDLNSAEVDGDLDVFHLPAAEQKGYACFRLLAHLEADLLVQLDPGLTKS